MKTLLVILLCLMPAFPQGVKVNPDLPNPPNPNNKTAYDRFADTTSVRVSIQLTPSLLTKLEYAFFSVSGIIKGADLKNSAPIVMVGLTSGSQDWVFLRRPNELRVILDGKDRLLIGEMKRVNSKVSGRGVMEQLVLRVPFSVVEKLSRATKLEMQIGLEEFELKSSQIEELKDWVKHFPVSQSKPKPNSP